MKKNLLLLFVSLLVAVTIAEIFCRIKGNYVSYGERSSSTGYASPFETRNKYGYGWNNTPRPHTSISGSQTEYHYTWQSNNEGLRDKELDSAKSGKRVLVFGDSFTEGMGAPNDSAYPRLLENIIRQQLDSTAQVINCGAGGADVFTEYKLLTGKMMKYKPDYILLTFNQTDIYEYTIRGGFERFKENNRVEYRKAPWFEPLYAHSYLVRILVHDVCGYDYRFLKSGEATYDEESAVRKICCVVDSFNQLCAANNIRLGMVFHPMQFEFTAPVRQYEPVMAYCRQQQIPYVDDYEYLKQQGVDSSNYKPIYWPMDGHFNAKGYELMAKAACGLFLSQGWLLSKTPVALQ